MDFLSGLFGGGSGNAAGGAGGTGGMLIWMVVIFGVMYFMMIRPQKK